MASLATIAAPHLCRRVRCRSAPRTDDAEHAEPFRFLSAQGAYTIRDRAAQWRLALAARFHPTRQPKGMDLWLEECVPFPPFCPVYLPPRGGDYSRFVPGVCGVCQISRQTVFYPGARHRSLVVLRWVAQFGAWRQA